MASMPDTDVEPLPPRPTINLNAVQFALRPWPRRETLRRNDGGADKSIRFFVLQL
jgi:hypothetical protein